MSYCQRLTWGLNENSSVRFEAGVYPGTALSESNMTGPKQLSTGQVWKLLNIIILLLAFDNRIPAGALVGVSSYSILV